MSDVSDQPLTFNMFDFQNLKGDTPKYQSKQDNETRSKN